MNNKRNTHRLCISVSVYFFARFSYLSQNTTLQHVVTTLSGPSGIAVDSVNDHVYWVYHGSNTLSRCKSDGTNVVTVVLSTGFSDTFMIRLDITNRYYTLIYLQYCLF